MDMPYVSQQKRTLPSTTKPFIKKQTDYYSITKNKNFSKAKVLILLKPFEILAYH